MVIGFGQNYACFYQGETQAAHWFHNQVTVHPIVAYYKCPEAEETVKKELIFLSPYNTHDSSAVASFVHQVIGQLKVKRGLSIGHLIQFTNGCCAHNKSKRPFKYRAVTHETYGFPVSREEYMRSKCELLARSTAPIASSCPKNDRKKYYMTRFIATMIMTSTLMSDVDRNRKSVIATSGHFYCFIDGLGII